VNKKLETIRDRRLLRDEEKLLLDAALQQMNTPKHQCVGPLLHDRIIGALELCCRRGEMLMIQNKRVNWETCQIGIPGATAKDEENRRIPFNPQGRVAAILERRAALGPDAFVFGSASGALPAEHPDRLGNAEATRERHRTEARKGGSAMESRATRTHRSPLARPAPRGRVPPAGDGVDIRITQLMLGHASIHQTQRYLNVTDEELRRGLEVSWKNQGRPLRLASGS
jgi:integrase